jgi:hypothetical protein
MQRMVAKESDAISEEDRKFLAGAIKYSNLGIDLGDFERKDMSKVNSCCFGKDQVWVSSRHLIIKSDWEHARKVMYYLGAENAGVVLRAKGFTIVEYSTDEDSDEDDE